MIAQPDPVADDESVVLVWRLPDGRIVTPVSGFRSAQFWKILNHKGQTDFVRGDLPAGAEVMSTLTASPEQQAAAGGPDDGHLFEISFTIRGSSAVVGEPHHHDSGDRSDPLTIAVRAWNLRDALATAAALPLPAWSWPDEDDDATTEAGT